MWNMDVAAIRETLAKIAIATNGAYNEQYLLTLSPFEIPQLDEIIAKIIEPMK